VPRFGPLGLRKRTQRGRPTIKSGLTLTLSKLFRDGLFRPGCAWGALPGEGPLPNAVTRWRRPSHYGSAPLWRVACGVPMFGRWSNANPQDARGVCENHPDMGMASAATPPACHAPTAMSCTTASGLLWLPISLLRLIGIRGQSTNARAGSPRFPQPGVNRMPQEVVGGPGQIGDLGDKLRLDPMDTRKDERRSEARFLVRQDLQRRCLCGLTDEAAPQIGEHLDRHPRAQAARHR
jgi:hypothetical protein